MSSKKVPYHKHREAEEARKKVRVQPFRVTLQPYLTLLVLRVHVFILTASACEEGGR
jgi:hypothetical protein